MLFDPKELKRDYALVESSQTGEKALELAGKVAYLVISFPKHRFAVVKSDEFRFKLKTWKKAGAVIAELPAAILEPHWVESLDVDQPAPGDKALLSGLGDDGLLVVRQGNTVIGLLVGTPKVRKMAVAHAEPPSTAEDFSAGTLSIPVTGGGGPAQPAASEARHINVELRDRDDQLFDPTIRPLTADQVYTLLFDVDTQLRATSIARTGTEFKYTFKEGEQKVELTVRLETDDFEVYEDNREKKLIVPRAGRSLNRATFLIQPKHNGECQATAVFLKDGAFIQVITLKFMVGELFSATTLGHDVGKAFVAQPRDVSLTIVKTAADAFQLILVTPGTAATATLRLKDTDLKDIAEEARASLMEVVYWKVNNKPVYQSALQIAPDVEAQTRQKLAETGFRMFQRLFSSDEQSKNLGNSLRRLAQQDTLKIQIFAQDFVFPWALLYMDKVKPGAIDAQNFLGMKHIIEHIPLQQSMLVTDNKITDAPGLNVSLNLNTDVPLVANQVDYWKSLSQSASGLQVVTRNTRDAVLEALADEGNKEQVFYFYGHGITQDVGETGGVGGSTLVLSGNGRLTLKDLTVYAPTDAPPLTGSPLIFINACESVQLSPLVTDGFVQYFMSKGARGVIGTECEVPALFAVNWAWRFFERFLKGDAVGQIFLDLRKEFYEKEKNILGLLYSLYIDGDTRLENPLTT